MRGHLIHNFFADAQFPRGKQIKFKEESSNNVENYGFIAQEKKKNLYHHSSTPAQYNLSLTRAPLLFIS